MSIINKFDIFNNFQQHLVNDINVFSINENALIFITSTNSIYYCDLADKTLVNLNSFIDTNVIKKFEWCYRGCFYDDPRYMALLDNGCAYTWRNNKQPKLIERLCTHFITDICCGCFHALLLTQDGYVYGIGNNKCGQLGDNDDDWKLTKLNLNISKVIAITCGASFSVAFTQFNEVFAWGNNDSNQLGLMAIKTQNFPVQLNVPLIVQLMCGTYGKIMLSVDCDLYFCGSILDCFSYRNPTQIKYIYSNTKFIKIAASSHLCAAMSTDHCCYIIGMYGKYPDFVYVKELMKTEFTSLDETFAFYQQMTYRTIEINESNANKYKINFNEFCSLGTGGFSTVFKAKQRSIDKFFAIKKVCFKSENKELVTKEIKFLSQLDSKFVVKYVDSWIEPNYYIGSYKSETSPNLSSSNLLFSPNLPLLLHIQMELCFLTLRDAINIIKEKCLSPTDKSLSLIGYYVSSELFYEIIECVQYLHSQNPAIIHRDLKPENILITNFDNNRFIKLSDFGLSRFHEFSDQSHTRFMGTKNYRAFEVDTTRKYTTKADIYSLGVILQELFLIDINETTRNVLSVLNPKITYMVSLTKKLLSLLPEERPICEKVLSEKYLWLSTDEHLLSDKHFRQVLSKSSVSKSIEENFIEFFIQNKCDLLRILNNLMPYQNLPTNQMQTSRPPIASLILDKNEDGFEYYTVLLKKSDSGFGLRLMTENSGHTVISGILIGSAAHCEGVLKNGDEIVAINKRIVTGVGHKEVVHIIAESGSQLSINVRRKIGSTVV